MTAVLQPSKLQLASAIVVIAGASWLVSLALAAFFDEAPCGWVAGVMLLPWPVVIGFEQYRSTFRCHARSARRTAACLVILAGLPLIAGVALVAASLVPRVSVGYLVSFWPFFAVGGAGLGAGWLNWRWAKDLEAAAKQATSEEHDDDMQRSKQLSLREALGAVAMLSVSLGMTSFIIRRAQPQFAEDVEPRHAQGDLPPDAADISNCFSFDGTEWWEFTVSEVGFRRWIDEEIGANADAVNIALKPITPASPYEVIRHATLSTKFRGPDRIEVMNGFVCSVVKEGTSVLVVFDRDTNRCYYRRSTR